LVQHALHPFAAVGLLHDRATVMAAGAAIRAAAAADGLRLTGRVETPSQADIVGLRTVDLGQVGDGPALVVVGGIVACGGLHWDVAARDGTVSAEPNPFTAMWAQGMAGSVELAAVRQGSDTGVAKPVEPMPRPLRRSAEVTLTAPPLDESADDTYGRAVAGHVSVDIVGTIVIGRAPTPIPGEACQVLRVPSPERSISRNHVVLRIVDGDVVALDLGSSNGTRLSGPGRSPVDVSAVRPIPVRHGDVLDLGEGVTVSLIGLP